LDGPQEHREEAQQRQQEQQEPSSPAEKIWPHNPQYKLGTGGGVSCIFPRPAWQLGIVPVTLTDSIGGRGGGRGVPDVVFNADPRSGWTICCNSKSLIVGGASCASVAMAALVARMNLCYLSGFNAALYSLWRDPVIRNLVFKQIVHNDHTITATSPTAMVLKQHQQHEYSPDNNHHNNNNNNNNKQQGDDSSSSSLGSNSSGHSSNSSTNNTLHAEAREYNFETGLGALNGTQLYRALQDWLAVAGSSSSSSTTTINNINNSIPITTTKIMTTTKALITQSQPARLTLATPHSTTITTTNNVTSTSVVCLFKTHQRKSPRTDSEQAAFERSRRWHTLLKDE
jgi:hypothetical protein